MTIVNLFFCIDKSPCLSFTWNCRICCGFFSEDFSFSPLFSMSTCQYAVCLLVVSLCCPFSLLFPLTLKPIKDSYFEVDGCLFISLKLVHLLKGKSNLTGYCTKKPNNRPTSLAFFCVHKAKELHPSICIELTQSSKHNLIYSWLWLLSHYFKIV